jgi:hypothetical protein
MTQFVMIEAPTKNNIKIYENGTLNDCSADAGIKGLTLGEIYRIAKSPEIALEFSFPIESVKLSPYEKIVYSSLLCNLIGMGIESVSNLKRVGRVMSMDVSPHKQRDPTILVCREMDLKEYYKLWSSAVRNERISNGWDTDPFRWNQSEFLDAIRKAVISAKELSRNEIFFAIFEMLKFQNEMMCR